MDTGYGCSQILPILTAAYNTEQTSILMIQQPEIHLHPSAQAELGDLFVDIANDGPQMFIETHSEHLLIRVQSLIAEGKISPEDVSIYYIYGQEGKKRMKKYVKMDIGDDGHFINEWPEGFFPEKWNSSLASVVPNIIITKSNGK